MVLKRIKTAIFELQNLALRKYLQSKFLEPANSKLVYIGNNYSGYWFPQDLLKTRGTLWGVGLGFDSSFEFEMLQLGFKVFGFEPEPNCFNHSKNQLKHENASIYNFGLWDKEGDFSYTGNNFSLVDIFQKGDFHEDLFRIESLWTTASKLKLETAARPTILRMNIEGAEYEILKGLCTNPLPFDVIIFQAEFLFHLPFFAFKKKIYAFKELVRILRIFTRTDWQLVGLNRHQFTLISRKSILGMQTKEAN
jgi:FkbM family methyltransferase